MCDMRISLKHLTATQVQQNKVLIMQMMCDMDSFLYELSATTKFPMKQKKKVSWKSIMTWLTNNHSSVVLLRGVVNNRWITMGYCVLCKEMDWSISEFFLMSQYRNSGCGRRFLSLISDYAKKRGAKSIFILVNVHNKNAHHLYTSYGFEPLNVILGKQLV